MRRIVPAVLIALVISSCGDGPTGPVGAPVIDAVEWIPSVVTNVQSDTVRLRAYIRGGPTAVELKARDVFEPFPLRPTEETAIILSQGRHRVEVWEASIPAAEMTERFTPGFGAHFAGRLRAENEKGESDLPIKAVIAEGLAPVQGDQILPDVQISDRVINVRYDPDLELHNQATIDVLDHVAEAMEILGLAPDFIVGTGPVWISQGFGRARYRLVRNDTRGIGLDLVDLSDREDIGFHPLANHPTVDGVISVGDPALFDLASPNVVHEYGHRFTAYIEEVHGDPGGFHWPISDLAVGVMGYQLGRSQERFRYRLEENQNGGLTYVLAPIEFRFNTMELYLMGLLPAAGVDSFRIFDVPDPSTLPPPDAGTQINEPFIWIDALDVVAEVGPRDPAWPEAPTEFRVATVVLSRDRLLTPAELAYYDAAAARGEARDSLPWLEVFPGNTELTLPFYVATGGRGTLVTRIRD